VLPDAASRSRLHEAKSAIFTEKYADYLQLGVEEWRKSYAEHEAMGKKAVLFVMVDDTRNCDEVGSHLERIAPELAGAVLVIHSTNNGEISEAASGKNKDELERLRKQSNEIDTWKSPFKAIVSVLMLKEGWDVRNGTTIVGLRVYAAESKILPEQTLGRGLRRMYFGTDQPETVSVMGTSAFMEFVESIQSEGVTFDRVPMGGGATGREDPLVVEVDTQNQDKDIEALDITLPKLARRFHREFKDLAALDPASFKNLRLPVKPFTPEQTREIVFKTMLDGEQHHTIERRHRPGRLPLGRRLLRAPVAQVTEARRWLRPALPQGRELPARASVRGLAGRSGGCRDPAQPFRARAGKLVFDHFKAGINALTVQDSGATHIEDRIRPRDTRPFRTQPRGFVVTKKSVFNRMVGEAGAGGLELEFAAFLEAAEDVCERRSGPRQELHGRGLQDRLRARQWRVLIRKQPKPTAESVES
jgi:type III restriction enzyme